MVITEAGNDPRVAGLAYIAAFAPDEGQSVADLTKPYPAVPGNAESKADADGYISLTRQGVDEDFAPDLPAAERTIVYATQGPWNSKALGDKVTTGVGDSLARRPPPTCAVLARNLVHSRVGGTAAPTREVHGERRRPRSTLRRRPMPRA
jgi:hypothetical protein